MNDTKYHKHLRSLIDELERTGNPKSYDPDAYNDVVDRLNRLLTSKIQCRRRRPWSAIIIIIVLLLCLAWFVILILFLT